MHATPTIFDIRGGSDTNPAATRAQVISGLLAPQGHRTIPTLMLYDEHGLRLYDDITMNAPAYYLFGAEEEILRTSANDIVRTIRGGEMAPNASDNVVRGPGTIVLELGAGALRKTSHLLKAFAEPIDCKKQDVPVTYYALDLEQRELLRTLSPIVEGSDELAQTLRGRVEVRGLCGTYDDGIKLVKRGGLCDLWNEDNVVARVRDGVLERPLEERGRGRERLDSTVTNGQGHSVSPHSQSLPSTMHDSAGSSSGITTPVSDEDAKLQSNSSSAAASTPAAMHPPLHILFLGSSIGNFPREEAGAFLRSLPLRPGSGDTLLLGLDGRNAKELIEPAYNDEDGWTTKFIMNGLTSAGRLLGEGVLDPTRWEYFSRYDEDKGRHEAYYKCTAAHTTYMPPAAPTTPTQPGVSQEVSFSEGELINVEYSYKFSDADAFKLFNDAQLRPVYRWHDSRSLYSLWLLERPPFWFPLLQQPGATPGQDGTMTTANPFGVPTLSEWKTMWATWDHITLGMIPTSMLHTKPIDLRHICLFYLGHIPAFLDINLSRLLDEPHSEPIQFKDIFERGIDPHVDDPDQCHPHSEVPTKEEDWPSLFDILAFRDRVRNRLTALYGRVARGERIMDRRTARVLFMTFEHEGFHAETLLYMLLQRAGTGTNPPTQFMAPPWDLLKAAWDHAHKNSRALTSPTVTIGPATVVIGHDDFESEDSDVNKPDVPKDGQDAKSVSAAAYAHEYGWDNENPAKAVEVAPFKIEWRAVTNGDFFQFWDSSKGKGREIPMPASWVEVGGVIMVRTFHGPVPIEVARHWPVVTSYDDLSTYAIVKGGRLPTEPELRLFMNLYNHTASMNVGFRNWHPVPGTTGSQAEGGKGHNGGVWEWTSTIMEARPGFEPSKIYPGYSADFFDQAHHVVIGGSYATIPRIAQRPSLRNFYQHNYPYAWNGARVVYDV